MQKTESMYYFDYGFFHKPNRTIFYFVTMGRRMQARQPKFNFKKVGDSILILHSLVGNDASHHLYPIVSKSRV